MQPCECHRWSKTAVLVAAMMAMLGMSSVLQAGADDRQTRGSEVWLVPPGDTVLLLARHPDKWTQLRRELDGIKLYIGTLRRAEEAALQQLAQLVREADLKVAVECGGTLNPDWGDQVGERSARVEGEAFQRWTDLGGRLDYLDMDGPVRRLLGHGLGHEPEEPFTSLERCARELVDYMQHIREMYPDIEFFLLTNFPNWGYGDGPSYHARGPERQDWGDYEQVLTTVLEAVNEADVSLAGITVDNPYEYLIGEHMSVQLEQPEQIDWAGRVRSLEQRARAEGLEFNLIVNSQEGGHQSDAVFYDRSLEMLEHYRQAGGEATRYLLQSWYDHPKQIVPETAEHSMTALALEATARLTAFTR